MKKTRRMPQKRSIRAHDSLSAAASAMGLSKQVLQWLKRKGAEGFRHGRVYEAELRNWIAANPEAFSLAIDSPGDGKDLSPLQVKQLELLEIKLKKEMAGVVTREVVRLAGKKAITGLKAIARKYFAPETYTVFCKETKYGFNRLLDEIEA